MLKILKFNQRLVTEVQFQFSEDLDPNLGLANLRIFSNLPNVPDLEIKSIRIKRSVLSIVTAPQLPMVLYQVQFLDTPAQPFQSITQDRLENQNIVFFIGQEDSNDIRDSMLDSLSTVYNVDRTTLVRKIIANIAEQLLRARTDVLELGNSNYLAETITDEIATRGFGPTDRLAFESAFEVLRVAKTPTGATQAGQLLFNADRGNAYLGAANSLKVNYWPKAIPVDPVSFQSIEFKETISNAANGLVLTLQKSPVAVVNSVVLTRLDGSTVVYDLPRYGYALLNNRYDSQFGRSLLTLTANQIELSAAAVLAGEFPAPVNTDQITVNYVYLDRGINIDPTSVIVSKVLPAVREKVPALLNVFSLQNAPVVNASDQIPVFGGIQFLDPAPTSGAQPFTVPHPAFLSELAFSLTQLPAGPGEYSVDYAHGQVYVYGAQLANGSGRNPPVATYLYRKVFQPGLDYNVDGDSNEFVALASRDLAGQSAKVTFNLEHVFAVGIDYLNETHLEAIDEFVENRFLGQNQVGVLNRPLTNVFEVLNETTGERYTLVNFDDHSITFNGFQLPTFVDLTNEIANFSQASAEDLLVSDELANNVFKLELQNANVVSGAGFLRAANVNTSVSFSRADLFKREFYYDSILEDLGSNLGKLQLPGDYLVDSELGIVYVKVTPDQNSDLGTVSYRYGVLVPGHSQILGLNGLNYRKTIKSDPALTLNRAGAEFTSNSITVETLPESLERFLAKDPGLPILLGADQFGVAGQQYVGTFEFIALDGSFTSNFQDGFHILRIPGEPDRAITAVTSSTTLLVDLSFTQFDLNTHWYVVDFQLTDGYELTVTEPIDFVRGVYSVEELQTLPLDQLTNYYDPRLDTVQGNTITFNSPAIKALPGGTALAVDYSFGTLFVDYKYAQDVLRVSYEYGDNSLNFGISDVLNGNDQYFVTYKFGALRDKLLENFGVLTQLIDLTTFPLDLDRELYRNFLRGTLQGFLKGPTTDSIQTLVADVTGIRPNLNELDFNQWTLDRDNLHLVRPKLIGPAVYDAAKYGDGLVIGPGNSLKLPAESYISFREGTAEVWVKPYWSGIANDAAVTFDLSDGYENIFIGAKGFHPTERPFTLRQTDPEPTSPVGQPIDFQSAPGQYVWFDPSQNNWHFASFVNSCQGLVTTSGEFGFVSDGYALRSTDHYVEFDGYGDGYLGDGYELLQDFSFTADDLHRVFDSAPVKFTRPAPSDQPLPPLPKNRLTVFKDGSGYLNFRVRDRDGRLYNVSRDIRNWRAGDLHHVAASWRFNSAEGIDQLHLFVDGLEVSNVFKYGGKPSATPTDTYRAVAEEVLSAALPKTVLGGADGITAAGGTTFTASSADFTGAGILPGDTLTILDSTADGTASPFTINSVQSNSLTVTAPFALTLTNRAYSVNQAILTTTTNVDVERFAVLVDEVELTAANYTVERIAGVNSLLLNNGATAGQKISLVTLGLTQGRVRDEVYLYQDGYQLTTRSPPPSSLEHVDIFKIILPPDDGLDGYWQVIANQYTADFNSLPPPSNSVTGKTLAVTLGGFHNINFAGTNQVTVNGTTWEGPLAELINFTDYGTKVTNNHFKTISNVHATFAAVDGYQSFGSIGIAEAVPLTKSENNGEYALVAEYDNGVFSLVIFGSGTQPFILGSAFYLLDYPVSLNIPLDEKGVLSLGTSVFGTEPFNGVVDQFIFLNEMLGDIRPGESVPLQRSITQDFLSPVPLVYDPQTLLLLQLNDSIDLVSRKYKQFDPTVITSSRSVNPAFGDSIVFLRERPLVIDNAAAVFDNSSATIEFWVSPFIDSRYDDAADRYYVDLTALSVLKLPAASFNTVILPNRAKRVLSVRLASDLKETGTDYFAQTGSELFIDGRTIFLGTRLPQSNTLLTVKYQPVDFAGDRVSIFKARNNTINFAVTAAQQTFLISYPINWARNTWHRVMATLSANSRDGLDQMRLFVDGVEGGLIRWGTPGLIYGTGLIYGQAAVGTQASRALVANIDLQDTFAVVLVGNSFDGLAPCKARLDNIRFSNTVRAPVVLAGASRDLNFVSNVLQASPVIEDDQTTLLLDFDEEPVLTDFLSNLLSQYTPLFLFDVEVDDSFKRLTDQRSRNILNNILKRMKQAHTNIFIKYLQPL